MQNLIPSLLVSLCISTCLMGCKLTKPHTSNQLAEYQATKGPQNHLGQIRFIFDGFGTLNLQGLLDTHIIPTKVYNTALIIAEEKEHKQSGTQKRQDINRIMQEYGFILAPKIANWNSTLAEEPKLHDPVGFVTTMIDESILGFKVKVQVSNITCATCHGGVEYLANGQPTQNSWLGSPNTSLDFDGYLGQIYRGLVIGLKDKTSFMAKLQSLYPEVDPDEKKTIEKYLFPKADKVLSAMSKMNRVFPFENGGPGITNGVAAFKHDAHILIPQNRFHPEETAFVGIPDLSLKGFKSALTADGAYGHIKTDRFFEIDAQEAMNPKHLDRLAELANFFTFSAMGNVEANLKSSIPAVKEIFFWLKDHKPQKFPLEVDQVRALRGSNLFQNNCSSCHGTYASGIDNIRLLSFPNKLVPQYQMGTDDRRWQLVTPDIREYSEKSTFGQYVNAGVQMGGYMAPVLSGLWTSAPYLHNNSVPTLWDLMNPEQRPTVFEFGGHAIDMAKIGIRLKPREDGVMVLDGPRRKSRTQFYNTNLQGKSNKGHESEFTQLTYEQKLDLLEYMKLL